MAKNENEVDEKSSKPKGKKRKQKMDEEVEEQKIYLNPSRKASKRKSHSDTTKPKKHKSESRGHGNTINSDDELHEPTLEELKESEKPENTLSIETIRKKKKNSHHQNLATTQKTSTLKEDERNEQYLKKWQYFRSEWKFKKIRQISIQTTVLDVARISDEIFTIALDYLSGTKGAARDVIVKQAEEEINKLDEEIEKTQNINDVIKMRRYKRARELIQLLQ